MAKRALVKDQEKFIVRLPPGLRERVRTYAERHGRSMNAEIVRVLEREFPEPWTLEHRVSQLRGALEILKTTDDPSLLVDSLVNEVEDTLRGIAAGRVMDVRETVRSEVRRGLQRWEAEQEEAAYNRVIMSLDAEELDSVEKTGGTEKFSRDD